MQCPECQHEMVQSKSGWLCLNCGHAQLNSPAGTPVIPAEASASSSETSVSVSGVVVTERKRGKKDENAPAPSLADLSVKESRPEPKPAASAEPSPAPEAALEVAEITTDAPVPEAAPSAPVGAPTLADLSSEDHNLQHPAAPDLPPVAALSDVVPVGAKASPDPVAQPAKAPLVAKTAPKAMRSKTLSLIVGGFILLAVLIGAYYGFLSPQRPLAGVFHVGSSPTPVATVGEASPTVAPLPSASPTASPNATANDAQRQADLATYAGAYKAAATNGYYNTKPPTVKSDATDPTTGQVYQVITTKPTAVGQIYYWAGGQCGGAGTTPGKTSTKYLALEMVLEGQTDLYCVDVK